MEMVTNIIVWTQNGDEPKKTNYKFEDENIEVGTSKNIYVKNNSDDQSEFIEFISLTFEMDLELNRCTYYQIHTEESSPFGRGLKFKVISLDRNLQAVTFERV
ncbi:hypothetical protein [Paenibacillus graminis]|uniref:Uncharacterized protein n=1 Tax=Paenibacillus graminis TaxID=189425 RepID=A0A089MFW0_9BACL|nr:hypothetical protein [Paenibacillus graminis]AIQ70373.1 hypothetical protein PGRAT_24125 [Paenibacillus graminis]MEC0169736.1 hypothetical protein [Paenibacillus graminis]